MAMKATVLVGLDVHARQTHAAVFDPATGELGVSRLRMAPIEVVSFLAELGPGVVAVYEAGPTGFGLARAGRERGIDVRVVAPGSIPKGRAIASRPTVGMPCGWCGCWPPVSCRSRSCRASPTRRSATWCAASRTCAAT
jgi:hypothetical protein